MPGACMVALQSNPQLLETRRRVRMSERSCTFNGRLLGIKYRPAIIIFTIIEGHERQNSPRKEDIVCT